MDIWTQASATLANEFADLRDIEELTRVCVRLLLAVAVGGLLGWEREQQGKSAGVRTHILVCLGATILVLGVGTGGQVNDPMSRVIQGIAAGIGFLGAGTIIKNRSPSDVRGLTTAAGIWFTCAVGVLIGLGKETTAILSTLTGFLVLHLLPSLSKASRRGD